MKVCLFCEGCYPYIPGGVSSWVQMLVSQFPDIEFSIVAIATSREDMGEPVYDLPSNITSIQTLYLAEKEFDGNYQKPVLNSREKKVLHSLFSSQTSEADWSGLQKLIRKYKNRMTDLLMSDAFYEVCLEEYQKAESSKPFFSWLWNCRSMYFPFMSVLEEEIPEADIYHSVSTGYAGIMASVASMICHKPFLLSEHGIYTREREEDIIRSHWVDSEFKEDWIAFFKKLSLIAYQQASKVISLFDVNRTLQIELGCPEEKIEIIPNGVDPEQYQGLISQSILAEDGVNLGAILRVVPIKDVKTMILAFAQVQQQEPSTHLYIMGNPNEDQVYFRECQDLVSALDLKNVVFAGQVMIREYLPEIDLLLLSSISEGQPLSILEGLAAGIPYISTNVGDCPRLLRGDGLKDTDEAGLIVPIMDSKKMAQAILELIRDPERRYRMGKAGQKRIESFYQKKDFLRRYYEIYTSLAKDSHNTLTERRKFYGRNWI